MLVLVINCGSSSIKYQLYEMPHTKVLAKGVVERIGLDNPHLIHKAGDQKETFDRDVPDHAAGMKAIFAALTDSAHGVIKDIHEIGAVGHRIVHGGEKFTGSVLINDEVIADVEEMIPLAPLHNPANLTGIKAVMAALPEVKNVGVFDTAFHQTMPPEAFLYPLPYELYEKHRVRKYGFHGSSHNYVARRAAKLLGIPESNLCGIVCHLGNGASICAIDQGKSIDTTMGLTPLAGIMMGTRCGDIDPAIPYFLIEHGICADHHEVDKLLNKKSGILGVSEISSDMRDVEQAAEKDGPQSRGQLTLDLFAYRLKMFIGAYMALLSRVDVIAFTGGIGENGPIPRWMACDTLANLGVQLDPVLNNETVRGKEGVISAAQSPVKVMVIPTDEEGYIAQETFGLTNNG